MKNFIICTVFASLFALVASAEVSYFYWGVSTVDKYAFNYATIKAATSESGPYSTLYLYNDGDTSSTITKLYGSIGTTSTTAGDVFTDVTGYTTTGSKFLVELWTAGETTSDAATLVAWQSVDYSSVKANIFTGMNQAGDKVYTFTNFIPEPTSGLLLLLGSAALALRRKQKVA